MWRAKYAIIDLPCYQWTNKNKEFECIIISTWLNFDIVPPCTMNLQFFTFIHYVSRLKQKSSWIVVTWTIITLIHNVVNMMSNLLMYIIEFFDESNFFQMLALSCAVFTQLCQWLILLFNNLFTKIVIVIQQDTAITVIKTRKDRRREDAQRHPTKCKSQLIQHERVHSRAFRRV